MKDEIIDNIKADLLYCYEDSYSTKEEYEKELDYITNLQEENKNLKQINEEHRRINGELRKTINEAIEKLNFIGEYFSNDEILQFGQLIINHKEVLNILQGSDE